MNSVFTDFDQIINSGKKYKIIYADLPWEYWSGGLKNAAMYYDVVSIADLMKLPVGKIADDDSILCM